MKAIYWYTTFLTTAILLIVVIVGTFKFRAEPITQGNFNLPEMSEFLDIIMYIPIVAIARISFEKAFTERILNRLRIVDPVNYDKKHIKIVKETYNIVRYSFLTLLGYFLFRDTLYMPTCCHGTLDCEDLGRYLGAAPITPGLRFYMMFQLSYHLFTLFYFMYTNRKQKVVEYNELILHHTLAVFLTALSYLTSTLTIGVVVLFTADLTDFFLTVGKVVRDLKLFDSKIAIDLSFGMIVVTWMYYRVYVVCYCVSIGCIAFVHKMYLDEGSWFKSAIISKALEYKGYYYVTILLIALLIVLNLYWTWLIISIVVNRIFKKDTMFTNPNWGEKPKDQPEGKGLPGNHSKEE